MRRSNFTLFMTVLGFLFLYAPIFALIFYSFNKSKLVTVWGGFSTKWYGELFSNEQVLGAAWISLKIAFISASLALIFGTLAGLVLTRFGKFRLKSLLSGMIAGPLIMPEVITGLSLLLLFVGMESLLGWPAGRGLTTVTIAHTTFCTAYIAVIIRSRLSDMDASIEEAARDLGARPVRVFFDITIPTIAPALLAGWLLAFTLSLDDVVIASFVSGPGSSTLPMVIFSKVRFGVTPEINALATIMILFVGLGVAIATWQMLRKPNQS